MYIHEAELNNEITDKLILLSKAWEEESSCRGYRANKSEDIEGNRVFLAEENGEVRGYLFGKVCVSKNSSSVMPDGTPYFEVEEIYVVPSCRGKGVGAALFRFAEDAVRRDAEFILLSTATKNWKAIFRFYLDELDMNFWNARLFKKIRP